MSPQSYRPLIMGKRGAVASNHPLATQTGLDVLRSGGNAFDAAVAVGFAIGVVEPHMSGLGGDSFYHVYVSATGESKVVNATGASPRSASAEEFRAAGIPTSGPLSVSTPGTVGGLGELHARYGSKHWADLLHPAVIYAREGFGVTHAYRTFAGKERVKLMADPRSHAIFLRGSLDGAPPRITDLIVQKDLAETLQCLAEEGATSFYKGSIARRLIAALRERGALIDEVDLAACAPEMTDAITIRYRDYEIRQTPLNSSGFVMLQQFKIAERFDLARYGEGSAELIHLMVEAKKRAFVDRERYGGDPGYGAAPLDWLLSDAYADEQAASISLERSSELDLRTPESSGDTTYFCVVDEAGNAVSAIQSLNLAFGSGVIAGDTGILMNNRMPYWHLGPGHRNLLVPGRRVRHTMNAPMVFKGGKLWSIFGTPGGDNQVQVNFQVGVAMMDLGYDPQEAVEAPRWSSDQFGQDSNYPHAGSSTLTLEGRFAANTVRGLKERGHVVIRVGDLEGPCSVEVIRITETGMRVAGSDPRRDGWAAAY
jgi:gamma-glutamyltranspeptidase/glutathione hydrolase